MSPRSKNTEDRRTTDSENAVQERGVGGIVPKVVRAQRVPTPAKVPPLDYIAAPSRPPAGVGDAAVQRPARPGDAPDLPATVGLSQPLDDFPYQAQDFGPKERVFNGKPIHNPDNPTSTWQQWAYDLGASAQQPNGTWRDTKPTVDWKKPKNSDYYIYGKPVYAVSDGVVVNAWRNAPENPRPFSSELDTWYEGIPLAEQTWLHKDTRAGKVHGSGNFVMVREDNGNIVHYAHARPGTIPAKLCPHEAAHLSPKTWNADSAVPPAKQVRVKRGDFLFETGNSGTSSAPHLHLDRTKPDKATSLKLLFRNGLANPLNPSTGKTKNAEWESFAGKQIPPGPVLVWPARRAGGSWSWHGQPTGDWGPHFRHMADSGYRIDWLDAYAVAGQPYFNTIWNPASAPWICHVLVSGREYQAIFEKAAADGFALVHVDAVVANGQPRYNAVFVKGASMDFVARHGQEAADFDKTFKTLTPKGYVSVNASVVSVGNKRLYTTLYRKVDVGGWVLLPHVAKTDYQNVYNENAALGRRPYYVNAYKHGNRVYYSVVFAQKPAGPRKDRHGMTPKQYQTEFDAAKGLAIKAVSGVDGAASNHEYIAIWRKDT